MTNLGDTLPGLTKNGDTFSGLKKNVTLTGFAKNLPQPFQEFSPSGIALDANPHRRLIGPPAVHAPEPPVNVKPSVNAEVEPPRHHSGLGTRLLAATALCAVVAGAGYVAHTAYRAFNDSFVAPIILSLDSDLVLENKAKITELEVDRAQAAGQVEGSDVELAATEKAITRLTELKAKVSGGLAWARNVTAYQVSTGSSDLGTLTKQQAMLNEMVAKQIKLTDAARANKEAGVISQTEYEKEEQSLNELRLALLDNARAQSQSQLSMYNATLGQSSLAGAKGAPMMPEALARQDQLVRIELELSRLESEKLIKLAEKRALTEKIEKLNDLEAKFKSRPLFQAAEKKLDLAFVPYTQLEGVKRGAAIYECRLGFFGCKQVGTVAELVPGEVILPDPWGTSARGQYAVLDLQDHDAAKAKSLRVRVSSAIEQKLLAR